MSVSLTGKDVAIIDDRILKDFADGDVIVLDFPNDLANGQTGKDGNTIISFNSSGENVDVTIRVLKGSVDDKTLNSRLKEFRSDPPAFAPMTGEFIKRIGTDNGVAEEIYPLKNGIFTKIPGSRENTAGETDQAVTVYNMRFFSADRIL